jgi:hypothetical protein
VCTTDPVSKFALHHFILPVSAVLLSLVSEYMENGTQPVYKIFYFKHTMKSESQSMEGPPPLVQSAKVKR